jgi:hypothetical protein
MQNTSPLLMTVPFKRTCNVWRWKQTRLEAPDTMHATFFLVVTPSFHSHYARSQRSSRIVLCTLRGPADLVERQYPRMASVWVTVLIGQGDQCVLISVPAVRHLILISLSVPCHSSVNDTSSYSISTRSSLNLTARDN